MLKWMFKDMDILVKWCIDIILGLWGFGKLVKMRELRKFL